MKLTWEIGNRCAETKIGRFKFSCTPSPRQYKDGSLLYMVYQSYKGRDSSKEIITLGKIRAKSIEEVLNFAEDLISEIIPDNRTSVLLPDGSTLVIDPKQEGGDYPGAWIYRISPDTSTETDIAVVEMTKDNCGDIVVYVYGNTETDDFTEKTSIDVSEIK